jgi:hypothetical protein
MLNHGNPAIVCSFGKLGLFFGDISKVNFLILLGIGKTAGPVKVETIMDSPSGATSSRCSW